MIIKDTDLKDIQTSDNYIALGSFDGLHLGHLSLIHKVHEEAQKNGGKSIVYTFKNHPRAVLNKDNVPRLLMNNDEKAEILQACGIDMLYFQEFDSDFMKMTPNEFIEFLIKKFHAKGLVVGFNYKFGYKNMGDTKLLQELAGEYDFKLFIMEPCIYEDEVISSTRIRKAIEDGEVQKACEMLSHPLRLSGKVIHGRKIGRTIGFPTANLNYDKNYVLPAVGVYYTNVKVNNIIYKGITSVGNNPTVDGKSLTIETYILDFDQDIYEKNIEVFFIKKIRNEKKFNGIEQLKDQLKKDKSFAFNENYMSSLRI
ncbi:bifunctional riboflavin kinase/FAD synthetase [uncultured Clostridium sp.]|uniref:bifunctional riboflavin kinase/FAD synthetase n=1 Tax=uncultured Clostridium sp. TaxID=59620 RepID=UPI0025DAAF22|nr:bifunctional riboflavin kinase/FAD synthetase [uncultured Clostridium sp.]